MRHHSPDDRIPLAARKILRVLALRSLKKQDLAAALGVLPSRVSRLLNGESPLRESHLEAIAKYLDVSKVWLADDRLDPAEVVPYGVNPLEGEEEVFTLVRQVIREKGVAEAKMRLTMGFADLLELVRSAATTLAPGPAGDPTRASKESPPKTARSRRVSKAK